MAIETPIQGKELHHSIFIHLADHDTRANFSQAIELRLVRPSTLISATLVQVNASAFD